MERPPYAAIGIYPPGETSATLMSSNGKVVIFDTKAEAIDFIPILGQGRICRFSPDGESVTFSPIDPGGVNRAVIIRDYDVYNLPPGLPVRSEAKSREWRDHVHWAQVFTDCGQMERQRDGGIRNLATGNVTYGNVRDALLRAA